MSHIFLSYAHQDSEFALLLAHSLEREGFAVWSDRLLEPGVNWSSAIDDAIKGAWCLVLILSPISLDSAAVSAEWGYALGAGIPIVPVLYRTTDLPYSLQRFTHFDFGMGEFNDQRWHQFVSVLRDLKQKSSANIEAPMGVSQRERQAIEALNSWNTRDRVAAAETLGSFGDFRVIPALKSALQDESPDVRSAVALALGQLQAIDASQELLMMLRDSDWSVRQSAARALGNIGGSATIEALIVALNDEDSDVRQSAATALGQLRDPIAVPILTEALSDADGRVRIAAAWALEDIGDPSAVPALVNALKDRDTNVRQVVVDVLENIGAPEGLAALEKRAEQR